ncbi:hypothetical protein DV737_g5691, partial [Chaetothyriales sp. CBS 132003]
MDMPVNVPVDNPNADTEWNDILRSKGIIPQKQPDPEPIIQEALIEAEKRAHENRLEDKDVDELDELEDDEDEAFLAQYRNKRLAELSALQKASVYGQVYPLQKRDYTRDVTEASKKAFVLVNLTSSLGSNVESRLLSELWRQASAKYGDIKFCEAKADMCIEGYPERNCPTILVYKGGDIKRQILTLRELNGVKTSLSDLESVLAEVGAVKESDVRLKRRDSGDDDHQDSRPNLKIRSSTVATDDDGDDWD